MDRNQKNPDDEVVFCVNINTFKLYSSLFYGYCVTANYWSPNVKLFSCWKGRRAFGSSQFEKWGSIRKRLKSTRPFQSQTPFRWPHSVQDKYSIPCILTTMISLVSNFFLCFLGDQNITFIPLPLPREREREILIFPLNYNYSPCAVVTVPLLTLNWTHKIDFKAVRNWKLVETW